MDEEYEVAASTEDETESSSDDEPERDMFGGQDDTEEAIRAIGQTPMLDSVQKMLKEQQLKELREKELLFKELNEDNKKGSKKREGLGVQLYNLQQQLATVQLKLEESHQQIQDVSQLRILSEGDLKEKKHLLEDFVREAKSAEEKLKVAKQEENAVKEAVKQVEAFLEETRGEIAVMRRATHKTEEAVAALEKKKVEQDMFIDGKVERVKQLQEELALIEAQRLSQKQETDAADQTLREAAKEMNSTIFEKRQVVAQWNSTLISLQKRDEAYQAMLDSIKEKNEERRTILSEIQGYRKSALEIQKESELLVERKVRQEHALKQVEDSLVQHERAYGKLSERYSMMKKSLEQQDLESKKLKGLLAAVNNELKSLQNQVLVIDRNRHALELEASALLNDRITATKASKNMAREANKIQKQSQSKELDIANVENEISRVKIDKLSTQSHVEHLESELANRISELNEKDRLIEKYKAEIRQRHDQIEKKAYVVDRLNRKLEKLNASKDDVENLGPLEATIKNLGRETTALNLQNRELERQWLRLQTEFVKVVSEMEEENATVHELSSTETILMQKRKRLDNKIASQEAELKQLETQMKRMHNDMHKLNELIADHKGKHEDLANSNEILQADFIAELKELERQSVEAEESIEKIKVEKQALLDEIMESERQIKLWEKKIQLEKETQAALDPTVGQSEVKAMEKEIHRMRIRFDNLNREKERMIKEMETAIMKRESINTRKKGVKTKANNSIPKSIETDDAIGELTQADLRKQLKSEKKQAKKFNKECTEYERQISDKLQDSENISMELEKASNIFANVEDSITEKKRGINDSLYEKQKNVEKINRLQNLSEKYINFAKNPHMNEPISVEEADIMLDQSEDQIQTIVHTLKKISANHPHLEEVLSRVANLLE